jgi:type II secretory pathway component GspD/PulD (secretin)
MMQTNDGSVVRSKVSARLWSFATMALLLFAAGAGVKAQATDVNDATKVEAKSYETLYLNGATSPSDPADVIRDLRSMLPRATVVYVEAQHAISIYGTAEDIALAKQVLAGVDRPMKSYQLTYTLTETGGGQAPEAQQVVLRVVRGGSAQVKQGTRVPIVTGTNGPDSKTPDNQVQYVDVGLMIRAVLDGAQDHLRLHTVVEQSQVAERSSVGLPDPVIRQTSLDGTSTLAEGKQVALGSLDIPGNAPDSARRMKVEVTVEPGD